MKLEGANKKFLRHLAMVAFPGYRGRKIRVEIATEYRMDSYWDGGSRRDCRAVNLTNGTVAPPISAATNPMNAAAHAVVRIPAGIAVVEHQVFCGKDAGITIYLTPENDRVLTTQTDFYLRVWKLAEASSHRYLAEALGVEGVA
jgi:hypothetical protein